MAISFCSTSIGAMRTCSNESPPIDADIAGQSGQSRAYSAQQTTQPRGRCIALPESSYRQILTAGLKPDLRPDTRFLFGPDRLTISFCSTSIGAMRTCSAESPPIDADIAGQSGQSRAYSAQQTTQLRGRCLGGARWTQTSEATVSSVGTANSLSNAKSRARMCT